MSTNSCTSLSYAYPNSFCLIVGVDDEQDEFTADKAWIAGAFFLGLLLGILLVALLARPFLKAWEKKKRQDEENMLERGDDKVVKAHAMNGWVDDEKKKEKTLKEKGKGFIAGKKGTRFWRKKKGIKDKDDGEATEGDVDPALSRGMVDVMLQTSSSEVQVEMADQDMSAIASMERSMEEEKNTLMLSALMMLLRKKMEKRAITKEFYTEFARKAQEDMKDLGKMIDREKEEAEEKLKNDPKLSKDSQALETEMQKLQTHYGNKQSKLQRDFRDKMRIDLLRSSGMSEAEVEGVIAELMGNMAIVEEKLGLEQARQRRALEQRLAKRRMAMEYKEIMEKETEKDRDNRVLLFNNLLAASVKDGSMLEKQRDDIVEGYENEVETLRKYHNNEFNSAWLNKSDWLQQHRLNSFYKLNKKHEKEKAAIMQMSDKTSTSSEFIKLYHELMTRQHMEQEALCLELDEKEVQEMQKLKMTVAKEENKAMNKATEEQVELLETSSNLSSSEADKIIRMHKQQMENLSAKRQREKQAMLAQLQERLQQRLATADEAEARDQKEQETLKEEQMATMTKVLTTNMDLSEEAKARILKEHEQNMQAMSNQLLRSKLRQQKSLEMKLNQRKSRLVELKKQQEELQRSKKGMRDSERQALEEKLAQQIAKEEADFEEARQNAVAELRRQLAQETDEALKSQDEEIGLLIGRLQVGQARRKAVMEKQDAKLKELQEQLEQKINKGAAPPSSMTDQILQEHYNNVSHLNEQLQRHREKQERMISEKINNKKSLREQELESQLEEEAQSEYTDRQKRGAGYASLALMQAFLEQRHANAMIELETEMKSELEKSKSELNTQLQIELQRELETQRQSLLTQLAVVSKLSKKELSEAVSAATQGEVNSKAAKQLAKDLRDGVERAKTSLSMNYSDNREDEYAGFRRTKTDMESSQGFDTNRARRSSTPQRQPRQAFEDDSEEEEGF